MTRAGDSRDLSARSSQFHRMSRIRERVFGNWRFGRLKFGAAASSVVVLEIETPRRQEGARVIEAVNPCPLEIDVVKTGFGEFLYVFVSLGSLRMASTCSRSESSSVCVLAALKSPSRTARSPGDRRVAGGRLSIGRGDRFRPNRLCAGRLNAARRVPAPNAGCPAGGRRTRVGGPKGGDRIGSESIRDRVFLGALL